MSRPVSPDPGTPRIGRRIIICDHNAMLLSVTGLLRMSGYIVFQAHDAAAVEELCVEIPHISLLILNTYGSGIDTAVLVGHVRARQPRLPILHIGLIVPTDLPTDVPTLVEPFTSNLLMDAVLTLIDPSAAALQRHYGTSDVLLKPPR